MAKHVPKELKREDVEKYRELYFKSYGEELSYVEAEASFRNFLRFMSHVLD